MTDVEREAGPAEAERSTSRGQAATPATRLSDEPVGLDPLSFESGRAGVERLYDLSNVPRAANAPLGAIFERTARSLKGSLRTIASDHVEVVLGSIGYTRSGIYMESIPLPAIMAVVHTKPWGGRFLIALNADLIFSLVERTLGGVNTATNPTLDGRAFTSIETAIACRLVNALIANAEEAFATVGPVTFELEHVETVPRFINIASPTSVAALVTLSVRIGDRATNVEIFMPLSTLEPVRELVSDPSLHHHKIEDEVWAHQMREEVLCSHAKLDIVLNEEQFPLSKIMALAVGETLLFDRGPDDPVEMRCDGVPIAHGRAGHSGKRLAFKVQALSTPYVREHERSRETDPSRDVA